MIRFLAALIIAAGAAWLMSSIAPAFIAGICGAVAYGAVNAYLAEGK